MLIPLYFELWGAQFKLLFKTYGVLIAVLIVVALFQGGLMSFYFSGFTKMKMGADLAIIGYTPAQIAKFSLWTSGAFCIFVEFVIVLFTLNKRELWGIGLAVFFGVLSLTSYSKFIDLSSWETGFNSLSPICFAILPAGLNSFMAHLVANKENFFTFAEAVQEMVDVWTVFDTKKTELLNLKNNNKKKQSSFSQINMQQRPTLQKVI